MNNLADYIVLPLILVGFLLELIGIGLARRELHRRRREVEAHKVPPISGYGVVSVEASGLLTVGSASPAEPPSLEQRIRALEEASPVEQKASEQRAREIAKQAAETRTNALGAHLSTNIDDVRRLLLDFTQPTASARWSIRLLVAGLGLQTLANVVQVMTSAAGG
jgi:hypothetical protein